MDVNRRENPVPQVLEALLDEARAGLDPDKRYSEDPRWIENLELMVDEYVAGGFGDFEDEPELRELLDEVEGVYADRMGESDEGAPIPEELMHKYVSLIFSRQMDVCEVQERA